MFSEIYEMGFIDNRLMKTSWVETDIGYTWYTAFQKKKKQPERVDQFKWNFLNYVLSLIRTDNNMNEQQIYSI